MTREEATQKEVREGTGHRAGQGRAGRSRWHRQESALKQERASLERGQKSKCLEIKGNYNRERNSG